MKGEDTMSEINDFKSAIEAFDLEIGEVADEIITLSARKTRLETKRARLQAELLRRITLEVTP
jgi:hypothetical protein